MGEDVNARNVFVRCLKRARKLDVDAVIHAGDVFDHAREDRNAVRQAISQTVGAGIPFYYVFGNHDDKKGRKLLKSTSGIHLAEAMSPTGKSSVNLLGIDHSGQSFPTTAPDASIDMLLGKNALVVHESPTQSSTRLARCSTRKTRIERMFRRSSRAQVSTLTYS